MLVLILAFLFVRVAIPSTEGTGIRSSAPSGALAEPEYGKSDDPHYDDCRCTVHMNLLKRCETDEKGQLRADNYFCAIMFLSICTVPGSIQSCGPITLYCTIPWRSII